MVLADYAVLLNGGIMILVTFYNVLIVIILVQLVIIVIIIIAYHVHPLFIFIMINAYNLARLIITQ